MVNDTSNPNANDPRKHDKSDDLSEFEDATGEVAREGQDKAGDQASSAEFRARRRKLEEMEEFEELTEEPVLESDEDSKSSG